MRRSTLLLLLSACAPSTSVDGDTGDSTSTGDVSTDETDPDVPDVPDVPSSGPAECEESRPLETLEAAAEFGFRVVNTSSEQVMLHRRMHRQDGCAVDFIAVEHSELGPIYWHEQLCGSTGGGVPLCSDYLDGTANPNRICVCAADTDKIIIEPGGEWLLTWKAFQLARYDLPAGCAIDNPLPGREYLPCDTGRKLEAGSYSMSFAFTYGDFYCGTEPCACSNGDTSCAIESTLSPADETDPPVWATAQTAFDWPNSANVVAIEVPDRG